MFNSEERITLMPSSNGLKLFEPLARLGSFFFVPLSLISATA